VTRTDFAGRIGSFRRGACSGRNLYLWCDTLDSLRGITGVDNVYQSALLDLPGIQTMPSAGETRRAIADGVGQWLLNVSESAPRLSIAVLHGLGPWCAYRAGLEMVYEIHASDRRMTVLCAPIAPPPPSHLPSAFSYHPRAIQQYFRELIPVEYVVEDSNGSSSH